MRRLVEAQEGLWYAQALDPLNPTFNTGQYLDLSGPLERAAFAAAVQQASAEAEALSLRIERGPDGPVQAIDRTRAPRLEFVDLVEAPDAERRALTAIAAEMATPVDPATHALAGQTLYRLGAGRHLWSQRVHHLAIDGYGMVLLTARVAQIYNRAVGGGAAPDRPLPGLAGVWAEDDAYRGATTRDADADWWRRAMAGVEAVGAIEPGRAVPAHHVLRDERMLDARVRAALLERARAAGIGWPDLLTALVAGYCRRLAGGGEVVVGLPHMGRMGSVSARVPAMVMNVLPLRVAIDEAAPLDDELRRIAGDAAEARRHGRYRGEQLRRDLGLIGGARRLHGPLVNVQPYDRPPRFHGLEATLHVTGTGPVEDINFTFRGDGATALTLEVDANPNLHAPDAVAGHGSRLAGFLAAAAVCDRLQQVPTATRAEAMRELDGFNDTARHLGGLAEATLAELIERRMVETPQATAVRFDSASLTYAELDGRTAALAGALRDRGGGRERVVAVALPRSIELVVALVAVLRAGAAFLPIDAAQPATRIAALLADAEPIVVLAADDPHGAFGNLWLPSSDWPSLPAERLPLPLADDPAYVLYTSGSTGMPKGVVVGHRAIVNRLLWMQAHYAINARDRILQKTPITFDVSVWEFFLPLISGATLVVAPPDAHRDPRAIAGLIRSERITALHFVPSMLAAFLDAPEAAGLTVPRTFVSGEALSAGLRDRFHATVSGALHNLYGPTEAAVDVSFWEARADDRSDPVPIGWPVWNTRLVILDGQDRPVPPGATGQLHIGGVQLAQGYLKRPALTAERFVADPARPGERLYRTGDLARRRADGAILFLGRADDQVKVRGIRIEPGEVDAAIPLTSATLVRDGKLVSYVVADAGFDVRALRAALTRTLPEHLVPTAIVAVDALPLTANGKLDRKALPAPRFEGGGAAAETPAEERLAALYAETLGVAAVGREDDFFALGGDSLSAVQLLLRVRAAWGHDPGLGALFETPDVARFAARIAAGDGEAAALGPMIGLAEGDAALAPLFLIHPAGGLCWGYRTLARATGRTVHGIQAPTLDPGAATPQTIDALAAAYATRIAAASPEGAVHLGGWSVGGIIAQAVAVRLGEMGRAVGLVALLDSYPADCWRGEPEPDEAAALRALLAIAGHDPTAHPELATKAAVIDFLKDGGSPLGSLPDRVLGGVVRTVLGTNRLVRDHRHRRYDGVVTHIRAALDHRDRPDLTAGLWAAYANGVDAVAVPFLHPQMTGAAASAMIAPLLVERMA